MKYLFFLLLIATSFTCFAQTTVNVKWLKPATAANDDTIYYNSDKKLVWPNFKGKPGPPSNALAITSSGFGYGAVMNFRNGKTTISVDVYCYFSTQNSWVRPAQKSDYALNHEQHHFDVTYIITNLFINKLKTAALTRSNYGDVVDRMYKESCQELEKMQNEYDGETKNGQLKDIQAKWNEKIEKQLRSLSNYKL